MPPASASPTHGAAPSPLGSPWRLRLLGSFSMERGGERVCGFGSRLDEQLLAYLALQAPTAVARRELVALFWPHIATATALKNLSVALFDIRKRLQEEGLPAEPIDATRQNLRLDPLLAVDVQDFLRALARAARAALRSDRDRALEEAISLFGAGLLPGIQTEWLSAHQDTFQQLYRIAMDLLSSPNRSPELQAQLLAELRDTLPPIAWQLAGGEPEPLAATPESSAAAPMPPDHQATLDPHLLAFCVEAGAGLTGPQAQEWTQRLEPGLPEVLAASDQALQQDRPDLGAQLIVPLWRYWRLLSADAAGYAIFDAVLQATPRPVGEDGARLLHATGTLAAYAGLLKRPTRCSKPLSASGANSETSTASSRASPTRRSTSSSTATPHGPWSCIARASGWRGPRLATSTWFPCITTPPWPPSARAMPTPVDTTSSAGSSCWKAGRSPSGTSAPPLCSSGRRRPAGGQPGSRRRARPCRAGPGHPRQPRHPRRQGARRPVARTNRLLRWGTPSSPRAPEAALATARASKQLVPTGTSLGFLAVVLQAQGQSAAAEEMMGDARQVFDLAADAGAMARFQDELAQLRARGAGQAPPEPA